MSLSTAAADLADVREQPQEVPDAPPQQEIVVGVDGSESALQAVRWAARQAKRRGARLRIVHAAPYLGGPTADGTPSRELPHARRIAEKAFTVARGAAPGIRPACDVVPDNPVTALLRAAAGAQLIVLGNSSTGAALEPVLARVSQRVAARATCPIVVVPLQKGSAPEGRPVVAVLGLGSPEDDEPVAEFAAEAARGTGRALSVIQTRRRAEDKRAERFPDLDVDREELPHATVVKLLDEACPTPMLVLTAGHPAHLRRGLDGVHRWLLRLCTSPMVLVPPADRVATEAEKAAGA